MSCYQLIKTMTKFEKRTNQRLSAELLNVVVNAEKHRSLPNRVYRNIARKMTRTVQLQWYTMVYSWNWEIISLTFRQNSNNITRLKAWEIIRILTRRAWNYFLIWLVTIWLTVHITSTIVLNSSNVVMTYFMFLYSPGSRIWYSSLARLLETEVW